MDYREYPPAAALRQHIDCFWTITGQRDNANGKPGRVTPDGAVEIVLGFADPMRLSFNGEPPQTRPRRIVIGQLERSAENENIGRTDYLGIRFRPTGIRAFLPLPQHELTGRIVSLDDLAPALDREMEARLGDIKSSARRIQVIQEILLRHCRGDRDHSPVVEAAVRALQRANGALSISSLMAQFDLSGRQIERLFNRYIGLSPKSYSRILRFKHVMRAAEKGRIRNWAELALIAGYYDQAHLIQDFRQFAGESPTHLFSPDWYATNSVERL
jgi:AraC-like DNA-binding protein